MAGVGRFWVTCLALTCLASGARALQNKTGQGKDPAPPKEEPSAQQKPSQGNGAGPKSGAGKALNRFLQGKKSTGDGKKTQEPQAGKSVVLPETDRKEKPKKSEGPGVAEGKAGEPGKESAKPDAGKLAVPKQGGAGKDVNQGETTKQGLQKFLQGKPKNGIPEEQDTSKRARGTGQEPGVMIPPPLNLTRGLPTDSSFPLSGNLSSWYRYRRSGEDRDQQLIGLLALDYGDPDQDTWSGHFLGRGAWDMDGNDLDNTFNGILQTYPNPITGRIYTLYVQGRDLGPFARVRLGRQEILETPEPAWIDGLSVQTQAVGRARFRAGGYIGRATRIYATSQDALSTGLDVEIEPWFQSRFRLDWMYVDQRQPVPTIDDQLFGLTGWQNLGEDNRLFGKITMVGDRGRDLILRDTHLFSGWGMQLEVSYVELMTTQRRQVIEFDLFTEAVFEYKPYRQFQIHVDEDFSDNYSMDGGIDLRRLKHSSDEGTFNREFDRYFVSASLHDLFQRTTAFNVTWDYFDSSGEGISALSADCICKFAKGWEARAGTTYSLFKYDWTTSREREHVRTYDLGVTWRPNPALRLRFLYVLEDDDIGRFHSLRAAFSWDF